MQRRHRSLEPVATDCLEENFVFVEFASMKLVSQEMAVVLH
jgi:hypothetical protein